MREAGNRLPGPERLLDEALEIVCNTDLGGQKTAHSPAIAPGFVVSGVTMARYHVCACIGCAPHEGSCPELTQARHCGGCAQQREQQRGSRQQRGYGRQHEAARAALLRTFVPSTPCPKCGRPMWHTDKLDAGHSVDLRDNPDAVADQLEHAACNRGWRRGQ